MGQKFDDLEHSTVEPFLDAIGDVFKGTEVNGSYYTFIEDLPLVLEWLDAQEKISKGGPGSGENPGHAFRGNQHTGPIFGDRKGYRAGNRADLGDMGTARKLRGGSGSGSDRVSSNPMTDEAEANLKKVGERITMEELVELRAAVV